MHDEFEPLAKAVSDARADLAGLAAKFTDAMRRTRERFTQDITNSSRELARAEAELMEVIEAHPELFTRPKTRTLFGIKFGVRKERGRIEIPDEAATLKRIERVCPELAPTLIITTQRVSKDALAGLDAATLKRLGVTVTADTDAVVIKAEDTEVDKLIRAAMKAVEEA